MNGRSGALDGLFDEARLVTCADYALRRGWPLKQSGAYLTGPCPRCGGDDRFSIEKRQNKWICRGCDVGGNDCISMVINCEPLQATQRGAASVQACELITGRRASEELTAATIEANKRKVAEQQRKQQLQTERYRETARRKGYEIWRQGDDQSERWSEHVGRYLSKRGLDLDQNVIGAAVRYHNDLSYWHSPERGKIGSIVHHGPAMLACLQWSDDKFGLVHMTWLDPAGPKGKAAIYSPDGSELLESKKMRGSKGDGAIRLFTPPDPCRLIIGEGIETTLTPYCHARQDRTAYWCALDLGHIAGRAARGSDHKPIRDKPDMSDQRCIFAPPWAKEIIFLADADSDPAKTRQTMQRAALRAKTLDPDRLVKIAWADPGKDFNDLAMEEIEENDD